MLFYLLRYWMNLWGYGVIEVGYVLIGRSIILWLMYWLLWRIDYFIYLRVCMIRVLEGKMEDVIGKKENTAIVDYVKNVKI